MTDSLNWTFSTLGCPELTPDEMAALARRYRMPRIELRAAENRLDLPAYLEDNYGAPENFAAWADRVELTVVALDTSAGLIGCSEEAKAELLEYARWAEALGCPFLRVFDGGETAAGLTAEALSEAVGFLSWWEAQRRRHGWSTQLMVETHDSLCRSSSVQQLAEAVSGELHVLWDSHHTWKKGGEDPIETWRRLRPFTRHVHIKDSVSNEAGDPDFKYTLLGEGEFPLESLFRRLRADGFDGPVSLEWERRWHPYLGPLSDALDSLERYR